MKTTNNNTDSTIINSAVILLAILLVMLSFQCEAQVSAYGCTDSTAINYNSSTFITDNGSCVYPEASDGVAHGFSSTALVQITSPTANVFLFDKLVIKYKIAGTSGWTNIVFPITTLPYDSLHGGYIDTLGISMWYFRIKVQNTVGSVIDDGYRFKFTVRLNNLDPLTTYKSKVFLKGNHVFTGANKTDKLSNTFTTWNNPLEAPMPTAFMYELGMFASNNQARLSEVWEHTDENIDIMNAEIVSVHNLNGQVVGMDAKGIVIYTFSNGVIKKVLR